MSKKAENQNYRYYLQLQAELTKVFPKGEIRDISALTEKIKILETYSPDKKRIFCLFSHVEFRPVYLSSNVETVIGFATEEIYNKGLLGLLRRAYWRQIPMIIKVHHWGKRFQQLIKHQTSAVNGEAFYCGIKLKDRWGTIRTFFIKQKILRAKGLHPTLSFLEVEEISAIYKSDNVWARLTYTDEYSTTCRAFFQKGAKKEYSDIVSLRELEILKLAAQQKNNTEISELLGISKNTVERHRKNMIARTGVTDMTALIHIGRFCQIL